MYATKREDERHTGLEWPPRGQAVMSGRAAGDLRESV